MVIHMKSVLNFIRNLFLNKKFVTIYFNGNEWVAKMENEVFMTCTNLQHLVEFLNFKGVKIEHIELQNINKNN